MSCSFTWLGVADDQQSAIGKRANLATVAAWPDHSDRPAPVIKVRVGDFYSQVLAEITENEYELVLVGADSPPKTDIPYMAATTWLARNCAVPLCVVRSCPDRWQQTLILSPSLDLAHPLVQSGQMIAETLQMTHAVLHVISPPLDDDSIALATQAGLTTSGEMLIRFGQILPEVKREFETQSHDFAIVGHHAKSKDQRENGPTLAVPNITEQIMQLDLPVLIILGAQTFAFQQQLPAVQAPTWQRIAGIAALELVIYAVLVVGYAAIAFRVLVDPLDRFFRNDLPLYAIIALLLIIGQGSVLEALTSFLMSRIRLERFE